MESGQAELPHHQRVAPPVRPPSAQNFPFLAGEIAITVGANKSVTVPVQLCLPSAIDPEHAAESLKDVESLVPNSIAKPVARHLTKIIREAVPTPPRERSEEVDPNDFVDEIDGLGPCESENLSFEDIQQERPGKEDEESDSENGQS